MCIEHEMNQFHQFVHTTTEFDEIQKLHETCLLNLISNLFIKNTFVRFFFKEIFFFFANFY